MKQSSRRRFLKQSAALAGLAAMGGIGSAQAQQAPPPITPFNGYSADPRDRTDYVPEDQVPKDHVLRDPWTGEMMRDLEGNLVVNWTGTPQWEAYQKSLRAVAGPRYGTLSGSGLNKDTRMYGERSIFVTTYRRGVDGGDFMAGIPTAPSSTKTEFPSLMCPVESQLGIITPSGLHFVDEHGDVPIMDPRQHRLTIFGMVDRPITLTMEELMDLPSVSVVHFLDCNSNGALSGRALQPWSAPGVVFAEGSCSEWTGVLLSTLLEMTGVKKGAKWFYASGADEYSQTWSIPLWKAMDDALVAYGQNGEPVRPEQGFPLRLLLPGFQGTMNIKRLRRIKVTDEPTLFHRLYTQLHRDDRITWFRMEHPARSCILRPSAPMQLTRKGSREIRGIAWSGGGKITRVEVTVDGGKTWNDAKLQEPVFSKAHTRFVYPWSWNGEEVMIASRATDERGTRQASTPDFAKMVGIDVESLKKQGYPRFLPPVCWKIDREGRVTNAIYSI